MPGCVDQVAGLADSLRSRGDSWRNKFICLRLEIGAVVSGEARHIILWCRYCSRSSAFGRCHSRDIGSRIAIGAAHLGGQWLWISFVVDGHVARALVDCRQLSWQHHFTFVAVKTVV